MQRRLATICLMLSLLSMGLSGVRSSRGQPALAQPRARPVSDASWAANVQVNDDAGTSSQLYPVIAVDGSGNAYAVWQDLRNDNWDIYFSYGARGGDWGPNVKVNDDMSRALQGFPAFAVDGAGNTYAVWTDDRNANSDIYFSHRPAGGEWGPNIKVNDDDGTSKQLYPAVAVDGSGNAYAVWQDRRNGNYDIYFSYRSAGGEWGPNAKVNDDAGTSSQSNPAIAVDAGGNAYGIWADDRNGDYDIHFSYRPAGGDWEPNVKVNDDTWRAFQGAAAIAVDGSGNAYAVWDDMRNANYDVYFSYRPAGGDWGSNVKVNDDEGTSQQWGPAIALDRTGNAYAVWQDERSGNYDILFSYRPAGGDWGSNVEVSDDEGTSNQGRPAIAVDGGGNAYAVWYDGRRGNDDIYFSYRQAEGVAPTPTPTPTSTVIPTHVATLALQLTPLIVEATAPPAATATPLQIPSPSATPYHEGGWLTARNVPVIGALVFCGAVAALIIVVVGLLVLRKR